MKNSQKGFIVPILIVIIVLLVIGGGAYIFSSKIPESSVQPIINEEPLKEQSSSQTISVLISVNAMNESVYSLLNGANLLGQKYVYPRGELGDNNVINSIDSTLFSIGDSCGATVEAILEIKNPKLEGTHPTLKGYPTVAVDVVRVVSHGVPQRTCAPFSTETKSKLFIEQIQKDLNIEYSIGSVSKNISFPSASTGDGMTIQKTLKGFSYFPETTLGLDQYLRSKMQVDPYNSGDATFKGSMAYKNNSTICVVYSKTVFAQGNNNECSLPSPAPQCGHVNEVFCADITQ